MFISVLSIIREEDRGGKLVAFFDKHKKEKEIWKDTRKYRGLYTVSVFVQDSV